jgi:hypothetical protein
MSSEFLLGVELATSDAPEAEAAIYKNKQAVAIAHVSDL